MVPRTAVAIVGLVAALGSLAVGCGGDEGAARGEHAAASQRSVRTTVYFLTGDGAAPLGVRRTITRKSPFARQALAALLWGPRAAERKRRITSAIPSSARLVSLDFRGRAGSVAVVTLTGLPPAQGRQDQEATTGMRVRVITQIARTLIGLSGIASVEIWAGGKPWDLWTMDGRIVRAQTGYDRLRGWMLICGGRSAEERRLGLSRCFSALP